MRILPLELGILIVLVAGSLILGAPATSAQEIVTPAPLRFTVYEDGVVHVDYLVNVDPTKPRAIVTVFGSSFSDLVVTDREGFPLDFTSADGTLTIDSLGADAVRITYVTHELTGKNGLVWTFAAVTPVDSSVLLPPTATVLSLSEMPKIIRSVDGQTQLIMGPGAIQAAYTLPLGGGVSPTAVAPTPTPTQPPPPPSSPQPPTPLEGASFLWIAAVGVAAAAAAAVAFALTRRRRPPPAIAREKHVVDVERLDRENPTLREDDREVLHFIAESGGEATEGEIRERFKLPKTTVWRMSNRLRKERIVDIYKTGGQNIVRIRKKYHKPEGETV